MAAVLAPGLAVISSNLEDSLFFFCTPLRGLVAVLLAIDVLSRLSCCHWTGGIQICTVRLHFHALKVAGFNVSLVSVVNERKIVRGGV